MNVGVNTRLSTYAITDGGISATANTCAGRLSTVAAGRLMGIRDALYAVSMG